MNNPAIVTRNPPVAATYPVTTPDSYAARGVVLSRDDAHFIIGCLRRDAYEMRMRGGDANTRGADKADKLAYDIGHTLHNS